MMKNLNYILLLALFVVLFSCNNSEKQSELPVIDVTKSYPKKDIVLQDIADVEYIPLETRDDALLGQYTRVAFVSNTKIIAYDVMEGDIFFFDGKGKFLHTFNHHGQSGREYLRIGEAVYDEVNNELFVYDKRQGGGKIQVYSDKGEYKRSLPIANEDLSKIENYDNKTLLAFEHYVDAGSILGEDKEEIKNLTPFLFISKATGKIDTLSEFRLKDRESNMLMQMNSKSEMKIIVFGISSIIPMEEKGSFMLETFGCDTIFEYSKDKKLHPLCVKTPALKEQGDKKVLLSVRNISNDWIFTLLPVKDIDVKYKDYKSIAVNRRSGELSEYKLINEDILTDSLEIRTKPELINADKLVELLEEGKLKGKLKDVAEKLDEEDNPVLIKVKFKE